jgi:hypothetical protein
MLRRKHQDAPSFRSMSEFIPEQSPDALLPWGDPYIVKLAQQLEREAREQIESAFRDEDDFAGSFRDARRLSNSRRDNWGSPRAAR